MQRLPRLLSIAGSDSGGGAGIQADLKTFAMMGCYGMTAVTAVTAQNTRGVTAVTVLEPTLVRAQIDAVFDDLGVDAVKIGMLGDADVAAAVADALERRPPLPLVLDPVMIAQSGDSLLEPEAVAVLRERLLPRTTVVTPNLPEAEALIGAACRSPAERSAAARRLVELGASSALVKGGHGDEDPVVDLLFDGERIHSFEHPRIDTTAGHGTGCTLSSALAAELGRGSSLVEACRRAGDFLHEALRRAVPLGGGSAPVHHTYRLNRRGAR